MKSLVMLLAFMSLVSHSYAQSNSCAALFEEKSYEIIRGDNARFYEVTELEMTREEFEAIRREAQVRRDAKPESRVVTHQNKSALADGNTVTIEAMIVGNKRVYQKEFDVKNANGYFEPIAGQYWIMPHNAGRLVVWNFTKNRVIEVKFPENTFLEGVNFDTTTNIFQPRMMVEFRKHVDTSEMVEFMQKEIDLLTGKEI